MSYARELFSMGMILLIFNVFMFYGVYDYVSTDLQDLNCGDTLPSNGTAITISEISGITEAKTCQADQEFLLFSVIGIVNALIIGVILYIVLPLPFVK